MSGQRRNLPDDLEDLLHRGFRYALSLTHDKSRAEGLLQDGCERLLKAGSDWHAGYLFKTIRNRWIDLGRREGLLGWESLDKPGDASIIYSENFLARDAESVVADRDEMKRLLGRLEPGEREMLYLFAVEEWTAREIAALTETSRNTVLSRIHRTRAKLRSHIHAMNRRAIG